MPLAGCAAVRAAAPLVYQQAVGVNGITLPSDPIQQQPTYDGALAAFGALQPIRGLFDNGAGLADFTGDTAAGTTDCGRRCRPTTGSPRRRAVR
jgi:uncharacterized protein